MKYNTYCNIICILKMMVGVPIFALIIYYFFKETKKNNKKQELKKVKVDTLKRIERMNRKRNI